MNWRSIPPPIPQWLRRHPAALAAAVSGVNRFQRLATTGRSVLVYVATALLGAFLVMLLLSTGGAALAMQHALGYSGIVVAASGLYAASLMSRRRRTVATMRAKSWLVATPRVSHGSARTVLLTTLPLLWRLAVALTLALQLSLNTAVSVEQSLQLSALISIGVAFGGPCGWWLSRRAPSRGNEGSRYTFRRKYGTRMAPSSAPLSHWPIAQAFAWGRPENARLLLGAAILTVPGGTGILGVLCILVTWTVGSYLVALLIAIPHVGRSAAQWLRSTPMTFWAFAWPLARRALLHQLLGTLMAMAITLALNAPPLTVVYFGAVWLTLVVLAAAVSLADCYRSRAPGTKTILSMLTALLAEGRVHGLGISIALFLTVLHLRVGANHERA
jgi:hypothetical protein